MSITDLTYLKKIEVLDLSTNLFPHLSPLQYMKQTLRSLNLTNNMYLHDLSMLKEISEFRNFRDFFMIPLMIFILEGIEELKGTALLRRAIYVICGICMA